jgi:cell division protein ZapE
MNLRELYLNAISEHGFSPDDAQLAAVATLDRVRHELIRRHSRPRLRAKLTPAFLRQWLGEHASGPVTGAYLWGGVGRGKTFIMDLFFESLPFESKLRQHFHRMMYRVHGQLRQLGNHENPLEIVADELAERANVICFDEFFVGDIADAMILGRLLDALFRRGVTFVATSNIPPGELYYDGLQRSRFLPAIKLLEQHTEVHNVDGKVDYRLRVLEQAEIYHSPLDAEATVNLIDYFERIAPDAGTRGVALEVLGRQIPMIRRADGIAWFDFGALCDGPRSQNDYIDIARSFQTVIVSDVPPLTSLKEDQTRRFIALVDEFYDRKVKLIVSAALPIFDLYSGNRLVREFDRTRSRLLEMQSTAYLAARHVP